MPPPPDHFQLFGFEHLTVVAVFVVLLTLVVLLARRAEPDTRRCWERIVAMVQLIAFVLVNGYWLLPQVFTVANSLPVHVSDVAALVAPLVLLTCHRWLRAIFYFWGLGLCAHAFITPDLLTGFPALGFWLFWVPHYFIVGTAIYDVVVRGYRPGWSDFRVAVIAGMLYAAAIIPLNIALDVNYGYLGRRQPGQPTLLQYFGPWPWRVLVLAALVTVLWTLMTLPWKLGKRASAREHNS
jgi:hypothetical integral membrane protein (TIGR02206 family)